MNVGILYLEAWLRGKGCVPLYDLMEDAATAEISRAQVWQWLSHGARLDDGRPVDVFLVKRVLVEELARIRQDVGETSWQEGRFVLASSLFEFLVLSSELADFLTLAAYEHLLRSPPCRATRQRHPSRTATAMAMQRHTAADAAHASGRALGRNSPRPRSDDVRLRGSVVVAQTLAELGAERLGSLRTSATTCRRWVRSLATRPSRW